MAWSNLQKVWLGWTVIIAAGLGSFVWAKNDVEKRRYQMVQSKKKIQEATRAGTYDPTLYRGLPEAGSTV